jgi:hypothetical protein
MRNRCGNDAKALRNRSKAIGAQSLRNRQAIAKQSPCKRIESAAQSLCITFANAARSMRKRFESAKQSLCDWYEITAKSLKNH